MASSIVTVCLRRFALEVAAQYEAGIAFERFAGEALYVAEDPGDRRVLTAPRHDLERVRVGHGEHVGFLDPAVPLDGRAVERHALDQGGFELRRGDREALQETQDVGEPETDEPDAPFLDGSEHVVGLCLHGESLAGADRGSTSRCARNARSGGVFTRRSQWGNEWETPDVTVFDPSTRNEHRGDGRHGIYG
jgi:hypothetical protein